MRRSSFRWFVRLLWLLVIVVAGVLAWLVLTTVLAGQQVLSPHVGSGAPYLTNNRAPDPLSLSKEGDGRITILLIGRGGDNHPGADLTDSIQLVSIDPVNKSAAFLSLPRDFLIHLPGDGYTKLNAVYVYAEEKKKGSGPEAAKQAISTLLDLPIHYYVDADFQGFKNIVDALGGIEVNVPVGLVDYEFPDDATQGYAPFKISAGPHHMDGNTALKYTRSRHAISVTGDEGSDFARSRRQQLVEKAIKDKALSLGTLTNPIKLTNIIQAVGNHLHTDLSATDLTALAKLVKDIPVDQAKSQVIDNSPQLGLLIEAPLNDQFGYHLVPTLGVDNYLDLQRYAHLTFPEPYLAKERAKVELVDATGSKKGIAEIEKTLKSYGYNTLPDVITAPTQKESELLDYSGGKMPYTASLLSKRFSTSTSTGRRPAGSTADLRLIIGSSALLPTTSKTTTSNAQCTGAPYVNHQNQLSVEAASC